jgi:YYY domain-containing protein
MGDLFKWWIFFEIIGWIAFPICFSLFKNLYTKGYSFTKIIGLLFWGYAYWIGNTFGIIGNTRLGAVFALIVILSASFISLYKKHLWAEIYDWIRAHIKIILFSEALLLISIFFMVMMRGANPEIIGTEKPMELAFINGILRSPSFPPNDPWLSGYSISYYYFGYLIIAAVIKIIGTDSGIAFNLALILWFALISVGAFGILFNILIRKMRQDEKILSKKKVNSALFYSFLAPAFLLLVSNGEGLLELLHSLGFLWKPDQNGEMVSRFWSWLDIKELSQPPPTPFDWHVGRIGGTWWWRASRVLQDYTIQGQPREIIDEFPFFSFLLGDLHPHVLAMPFVLLCIISGYTYLLEENKNKFSLLKNVTAFWSKGFNWFLALALGSLIFINTWDFPIYFGMIGAIYIISIYPKRESIGEILKESVILLFTLGFICSMFYLPFLISFSSQAGGILPSLVFQSRSIYLLVMFFPFIVIVLSDLIFRILADLPKPLVRRNFVIAFGGYLFSLIISMIVPFIVGAIPDLYRYLQSSLGGNYENYIQQSMQRYQTLISIYGGSNTQELILGTIERIISDPIDILVMITIISAVISMVIYFIKQEEQTESRLLINKQDSFIGLMIFLGAGLILFPEVFYLRDQFGWRMNTIFKFYFQSWLLFSISAAYAVSQVGEIKKPLVRKVIAALTLFSIISGFVYPFFAVEERIDGLAGRDFTLNGNMYLQISNPDEYKAVRYLNLVPFGVVSEAVGGSYSNYGRISKFTGLPTVLGWPGHELQWRGGVEEIGSRESDIKELYSTNNWITVKNILDKYNIRYIYIGDVERKTYQISEEKFVFNLPVIFNNSSVVIYKY